MYDDILRLELPIDTSIVGFADDVTFVVVSKELKDVEESCNHSIDRVDQWMAAAGLGLAAHKTLKYLEVMLDTRLSFREHLEYVHKKAAESCQALSRIMLNTRGPKQKRHGLLMTVNKAVIILSGHGRFRSYLKRFGHDNTDECSWCGSGIAEDSNHIIFECGRFSANREGLEDSLRRPITVDNLVRNMLKTAQKWEATYTFAAGVMLELRRVERNRWRAEEV
ncbi:uncharacterized protein [Drosophila virilis]|uniref:uncharacterized protein n=1 Tax=Drosophila virilis TaxID=7244 RepID=UPI0038B31B37